MSFTGRQLQVGTQIRRLRAARGMSVRTLAAQTGFSPSFISQVENGQASPSITSLERIATVLGVTLAGFFMTQQQEAGVVIRTADRWELASAWSQARIEALGSIGGNSHLEAVMITIAPGGRSGKQPASHPGEEFALVFDGEVSLTLGSDVHVLRRGDTASFPSETPHLWENTGPDTAQVVIVSPRFTH
jgi:transcriptional regulator with XRE-family HTH domain